MSNRPHLALSQLLTCRLQTLADPKDKNRIERGRKIAARWGPGAKSMNTCQLVEKLYYKLMNREELKSNGTIQQSRKQYFANRKQLVLATRNLQAFAKLVPRKRKELKNDNIFFS